MPNITAERLRLQSFRGPCLTCTPSSGATALQLPERGDIVTLTNPDMDGPTVYAEISQAADAASATDAAVPPAASVSFPILPGTKEELEVPDDRKPLFVTGATAAGTGYLLVHRGYAAG